MSPQNLGRTWVEIDSAALIDNVSVARDAAAQAAVMAVVKADAYGHGITEVTSQLSQHVEAFGVATLTEALIVRQAVGKSHMIMILGALLAEERETALLAGLHVTVSSIDEARQYSELATALDCSCPIHLVADTGMGRLGLLEEGFPAAATQIATMPNLSIAGFATHFPSADEDQELTKHQISRFHELCHRTELSPPWIHLANSAGILGFGKAGGNMVRPGLMLYGIPPVADSRHAGKLNPALEWKARITQVRNLPEGSGISYGQTFIASRAMRVATIAAGYGDGYPRSLSGTGAEVIIANRHCPLLGRVTMDMLMADVSHLDTAPVPGDTVTLIGGQIAPITTAELAGKSGLIPWEILTGISPRVSRVMMNKGK
ncbi:MAG: alanine racemase [Verrucomicrobiaceae bacterium]|nr:alanine racemase [Verrucomicrobiaceae bacterium]